MIWDEIIDEIEWAQALEAWQVDLEGDFQNGLIEGFRRALHIIKVAKAAEDATNPA